MYNIKTELDRCLGLLEQSFDRFPFTVPTMYAGWLAQTYYYVRHSTRLLAAAAARFEHAPLGDALHQRFAKHMSEEKQHEQLCLHDLKVLGWSIADLPEHATTRMFYEPQYYKIEHQHPVAFLGYILPLEAIAISRCGKVQAIVAGAFGEKCTSFLRVHAADDPDHLEKALRAAEQVPRELRPLVVQNLEQTTHGYLGILARSSSRWS